jgi:hypothetical protein
MLLTTGCGNSNRRHWREIANWADSLSVFCDSPASMDKSNLPMMYQVLSSKMDSIKSSEQVDIMPLNALESFLIQFDKFIDMHKKMMDNGNQFIELSNEFAVNYVNNGLRIYGYRLSPEDRETLIAKISVGISLSVLPQDAGRDSLLTDFGINHEMYLVFTSQFQVIENMREGAAINAKYNVQLDSLKVSIKDLKRTLSPYLQ